MKCTLGNIETAIKISKITEENKNNRELAATNDNGLAFRAKKKSLAQS